MLPAPPLRLLPFRAAPAGAAPPALTMRELARAFVADRAADTRAGSIGPEYLAKLKHHLRDFLRRRCWGNIPVDDFRPRSARRWLRRHKGWKSPHQLEGAIRSLRSMFLWGENEDLIPKSPVRGFKRFWDPPQPRAACRPAEYAALMRAARKQPGRRKSPSGARFRVQMWVLWNVGCRTCELRQARWEWLDLDRSVLEIPRGKTTWKTGEARTIYLDETVLRVLQWLTRRGRPATGLIFTARCNRPLKRQSWNRLYKRFARLAGIREEVTQYSLRHGYCVESLLAGIRESELAVLMGHSSTRMIAWYARTLRDQIEHIRAEAHKRHRRKQPAAPPAKRRGKTPRADQPLFDWGE